MALTFQGQAPVSVDEAAPGLVTVSLGKLRLGVSVLAQLDLEKCNTRGIKCNHKNAQCIFQVIRETVQEEILLRQSV